MVFFDKLLTISSFLRLPFTSSSNFSLIKYIVSSMLTSCNSPLMWLSFVFFVAIHNSSIFFPIFSIYLCNIKIQSLYFRESLKAFPSEAFSKDSFKLEASRCFLVSCRSLELLLNSLFFLSKKMLYYSWANNNKCNSIKTNNLELQNIKTIDITLWLKNHLHSTLPDPGKKNCFDTFAMLANNYWGSYRSQTHLL